MTPTEIGLTTGFVGSIFGAGVAWGVLRSKIMSHGLKIAVMEKRVEQHERSSLPHLACPSHEASLTAIMQALADIKADLKTVASQIFTMSRDRDGQ
jgi:hypothetical protein